MPTKGIRHLGDFLTMFEHIYDTTGPTPLITLLSKLELYLNAHLDRDHYQILPHSNFLRICSRRDAGLIYHLGYERGQVYIRDFDVLMGEHDLYSFDDVGRYYSPEWTQSRYLDQTRRDVLGVMEVLRDARITQPYEEDSELLEYEASASNVWGYSEGVQVGGPMTWFGFGGDPYWKQVIRTHIEPFIPVPLGMQGTYKHDPTSLVIGKKGYPKVLYVPHPYYLENEPLMVLPNGGYSGSSSQMRHLTKHDTKFIDFQEMLERTADRMSDEYWKRYNAGETT